MHSKYSCFTVLYIQWTCRCCLCGGYQDGTPTSKTFEHVASEIGAEEAEEVGVEHLLRSVKRYYYYFFIIPQLVKIPGVKN